MSEWAYIVDQALPPVALTWLDRDDNVIDPSGWTARVLVVRDGAVLLNKPHGEIELVPTRPNYLIHWTATDMQTIAAAVGEPLPLGGVTCTMLAYLTLGGLSRVYRPKSPPTFVLKPTPTAP